MAKITNISFKVDLNTKDVPNANKIEASDINEIISVVNLNDDLKTDKGTYMGTAQDLKNAIDNAVFDGAKTYQTEAELLAVSPIPANETPAKVANNTVNPLKNGNWSVVGGAWLQDASVVSNIANSSDIKTVGDELQFNERSNSSANIPKSYKRLRENIVEGVNTLTQSMINGTNTIFEIIYDYDLNGATLNLGAGCDVFFNGGSVNNGSILNDVTSNFTGDWKFGTSQLSAIRYFKQDGGIILDVRNLPGFLSKYNLVDDGFTDNSDRLQGNDSLGITGLIREPIMARWACDGGITLVFTNDFNNQSNSTYLFKKYVEIGSPNIIKASLKVVLMADIQFDNSDVTLPTLANITSVTRLAGMSFRFFKSIEIIGIPQKSMNSANSRERLVINGGLNTVNGDWYEGVTVGGTNYYSTVSSYPLRIQNCDTIKIDNIHSTNGYEGILIENFGNALINDVECSNIAGNNGLTIRKDYNEGNSRLLCQYTVTNFYAHGCQDIGLSLQAPNGYCENIYIEDCGNNNAANIPTFGVNNSFNAGGAVSIEGLGYALTEDGSLSDKEKQRINFNIKIVNLVVKDCYNYALFTDSGGIIVDGLKVDNIISTLPSDWESLTGFLYTAIPIRKGVVIYVAPVSDELPKDNIQVINSTIKNVPFLGYTISTDADDRGKIKFINCQIDDINDLSEYDNSTTTGVEVIGGTIKNNSSLANKIKYIDVPTINYSTLPTFYEVSDKGRTIMYNDVLGIWDGTQFRDAQGTILV